MRPIPVVFHLGPLTVHTYGIGLAITFYFAYKYYERRLEKNGLSYQWLQGAFLWIIAAAVVGARVVHVIANASFYLHNPGEIILIWHGGLSSFGGLAFAVPTAIFLKIRKAPEIAVTRALDLVAPVLVASWALGRLLGPQLMVNGGGRPTNAWYGLEYAGQSGYRIPVPLFQAFEDLVLFLILLRIERYFRLRNMPDGALVAVTVFLWSITRFWDEFFWLAVPRVWDAVEVFSIVLAALSAIYLLILMRKSPNRDLHEKAEASGV